MPTKRVKSLPEVRKLHLGIGNIKRRTGCAGSPKCVLTETHGGFYQLNSLPYPGVPSLEEGKHVHFQYDFYPVFLQLNGPRPML